MEEDASIEYIEDKTSKLCPEFFKCIPAEQCQIMAKILKDTPYANTFKELAKNIETIRLVSLIDSIQDIKKSSQEIIIKEIKDIHKEIEKDIKEST